MSDTILLVDDEEGMRHLIGMVLEMDGFTVLRASSGEEALEVARGHAGPIGLLVTDIMMPGIDGVELARRFVRERPELPVLFISGKVQEEGVETHTLRMKTAFMRKPFKVAALSQRVRDLLQ